MVIQYSILRESYYYSILFIYILKSRKIMKSSKVSPKRESGSLNIGSVRSSSGKNSKIRIIQASIKRKLLLDRTSLLRDKVFLPELLLNDDKYSSISKVQKFLKSVFVINRFTLDMRNYYYNYILKKLQNIKHNECLEDKIYDGNDGFTIRNIINLEKKIGTNSFNGSIYKTAIRNVLGTFPIATKLMENNNENNTEIRLMEYITKNLIVARKSKHFLLTYKTCTCDIIDYPKERKLISINEIANGDLNSLIDDPKNARNRELLFNIMFQCFISVGTFHNSVNNVHQDIHAGNFLWHINNEKGYYHYIFNGIDFYLKSCKYNVMLYDFGYANVIRSKKSILKILADYTEIITSFLKNEFEDEGETIAPPTDEIIAELYELIDVLMVEYKIISKKYAATSSSPESKSKSYQQIYFNYILNNILIPYSSNNLLLTYKPNKVINKTPYYIDI